MKVKSLSRVGILATPWTAAHQAPPSIRFSRQEYWSGVPLPSPYSSTISYLISSSNSDCLLNFMIGYLRKESELGQNMQVKKRQKKFLQILEAILGITVQVLFWFS